MTFIAVPNAIGLRLSMTSVPIVMSLHHLRCNLKKYIRDASAYLPRVD